MAFVVNTNVFVQPFAKEILVKGYNEETMKEEKQNKIGDQLQLSELEQEAKKAEDEFEAIKVKFSKMKGMREALMFRILKEEIKVKFTHHGELSLAGNECLKVLKKHEMLRVTLEGQSYLQEKFMGLFQRLEIIVGILYEIEPFCTIELTNEEVEMIDLKEEESEEDKSESEEDGSEDELEIGTEEEPEERMEKEKDIEKNKSQLNMVIDFIEDFADYFIKNFSRTPLPKHHFLFFHVIKFIRKWLTIGLFS